MSEKSTHLSSYLPQTQLNRCVPVEEKAFLVQFAIFIFGVHMKLHIQNECVVFLWKLCHVGAAQLELVCHAT